MAALAATGAILSAAPAQAATVVAADYDLGTASGALSGYLNSANPGRPNPLPAAYTAPATFDATARLTSWGAGSGSIAADGSAVLTFAGTSVNFAKTGGGWLRVADPQATLDAQGNGVVTAVVSYGTSVTGVPPNMSFDPAQAPTRGPVRLAMIELQGNSVSPAQGPVSASWSGLAGLWSDAFVAFLAGDATATPAIPAWTYASTVTNVAAADRKPSPISFELGRSPKPTAVVLSSSPEETAVAGTAVVLTAQVSPVVPGTVRFTDGAGDLATVAVDSAGVATHKIAAVSAGSHSYLATFTPAAITHTGSTSATITQAVTAAVPATPGSLRWGVKSAFRAYVLGPIAAGSVTAGGGAGAAGSEYWFPQSTSSVNASGLGQIAYRGSVTFSGHHGALSLRLADPVVRVTSASSAVLSLVTSSGRVDFAAIDLGRSVRTVDSTGAVSYTGAPATLTAAGATGFAGFYSAGTSLDPISFTIGSANPTSGRPATASAAAAASSDGPAATPPASEGITLDGDPVAGGAVTASADGFQPNESGILVVIYSEPVVLADDVTADADGVVTWTGRLPAGLTGSHTLTFQGSVDRGIVLDIAAAEAIGCPIGSATLHWGFKESFRSYLTGLAGGDWTTADGAGYETPEFFWTETGGAWDGERTSGLEFAGSVRFTGHAGALDTTIANPRLVLDGDRGALFLDVSGTTQDGQPVTARGIEFAELELAGAEHAQDGDTVVIAAVPATLTAAGSAAFGTYGAGEALDPITIEIVGGADCAQPLEEAVAELPTPDAEVVSAVSPLGWWLFAGGVLLVLLIVTLVLVLRRRSALRAG